MLTTQKIIATNLKILMRHYDLHQEQTAAGSGVSKQTISNLLNPHEHKSTINLNTLIKLAELFKIPVNYFFIADMTAELLLANDIHELTNNYIASSAKGREKITLIAKTEKQFKKNGSEIERRRDRRPRRKSEDRRESASS